ncbi:MAG: nucleotidyltransferase domain-containing protein [bacterium]
MDIKILYSDVVLDILAFLADNDGKEDAALLKDIVSGTKHSRKGVYNSLQVMEKQKLIKQRKIGRSKLYYLNTVNPFVRQFKVLKTVSELNRFVELICTLAGKIIIFGSASRGEEIITSDIDIAVIASKEMHEEISEKASKVKTKKKLSIQMFSSFEFEELKSKDPVYHSEIDRGIILWEEMNEGI